MATAERQTTFSEDIIEEVRGGGEAAIGAVRSFLGNLDQTLAGQSSPTPVGEIADSALGMADRLVETQAAAAKGVVRRVNESLNLAEEAGEPAGDAGQPSEAAAKAGGSSPKAATGSEKA